DQLKKKPQLIVGSAGRILELFRKGKLRLGHVGCLVLDEFDRLLDDQNVGTVAELVRTLPKEGMQYLMFSATAPKKARERADFLEHPEFVRVEEPLEAGNREDLYLMVPFREKIDMVRKLARNLSVKRGMVFVNRSFDAGRALEKLRYEGIRAESLLGNADKMVRKKALEDFRKGKVHLLLSTDLAARGLDIPEVDYVFNLDIPESANVYLHRAGRTARAGAKGRVVTLADAKESMKLEALEQKLGISLKLLKKPRGERPVKKRSKK
ncbi:MAG: DEAD/DEAH box helicase, partial [Selenomonadaceae bacterium]|nr:DEAD/DEAH box helicase [Selenomonadaceae bacterium]